MRSSKKIERIQLFFVFVACFGIFMLYLSHRPKDEIQFVSSAVVTSKVKTTRHISNPINFEAYHKENPDVYAYLYIDQSSIDYPILQHPSDDAYYLSHNIDGSVSTSGSIYTETGNALDFHDPNTVIYGHNVMDYGTMFHELLQYRNADYFYQHNVIYIYTETGIYQYRVFASYFYDDRHLLYSFDFHNPVVYQTFLDSVSKQTGGVVDNTVHVDNTDTIITLSTCKDLGNERFLVHAVLKQYIPCLPQTSVTVKQEMNGMKQPQFTSTSPITKKHLDKIVKKPTVMQELRVAFPYLIMIFLVILSYVAIHVYGRKRASKPVSPQRFHNTRKLRFTCFLIHAVLQAGISKLKFLCFLFGQLIKEMIAKLRFLCFLIKQLFLELFRLLFRCFKTKKHYDD